MTGLSDVNQRYRQVCSHGISLDEHCKRCAFAGFCACRTCRNSESLPDPNQRSRREA